MDTDTLQIKGNSDSILGVINKLEYESDIKFKLDIPKESIVPKYTENPVERFIKSDGNACIDLDNSEYVVKISRVAWR